MTDFQQGIITLMKCAITGNCDQLPANFSLEEAEAFARKQSITTLVYDGAIQCGISDKAPAMQQMFRQYLQLMLYSEGQMAQIKGIFSAFDKNRIDYLPLKGCRIKELYPKHEFRYMGDGDILIRTAQYDKIAAIMAALGFARGRETDHELHWRKPELFLELHKHLIPSFNKDYYAYYQDPWQRARVDQGTRYTFSPEDEFIHLFVHMAKHYRSEGIGCRYILDLWIFMRAHSTLNYQYVEQELKKLRLLEFYRNIRRLVQCWFEGDIPDEKVQFMTDYIFSGGSWGNAEHRQHVAYYHSAKKSDRGLCTKARFLFSRLFPPSREIAWRYPVVSQYPVLIPIFWLFRLVQILLFDRRRIRHMANVLADKNADQANAFYVSLQYVGLDFHLD